MDRWVSRFSSSWARLAAGDAPRALLVGVSAGADSVALARLLVEWRTACGSRAGLRILFGHIHHGLRGRAADEDLAFVERFAARWAIPLLSHRGELRCAPGRSFEQEARRLRYAQFARWARAERLDAIVLGHHRDDQAETVLLRAIRGTGLRGLAAVPPRRPLEGAVGTVVLRPFLGWTRAEILEFLEARRQSYRDDETNDDTTIARNHLRHRVLPVLEEVQPGAARSLARLAEQAQELRAELRAVADRAAAEARIDRQPPGGVVCFSCARLNGYPRAVLRELLQLAWEEVVEGTVSPVAGPASRRGGTDALLDALSCDALSRGAQCFELGGGVQAELRYGCLWLTPRPDEAALTPGRVALDVEQGAVTVTWGRWRVSVESETVGGTAPITTAGALFDERVDADRVEAAGAPFLRGRSAGDRLRPLGAPGRKSLKEFFRERRVRPQDRDDVPLVVAGDEIVWVIGHRLAHPYRVREDTRRVWRLKAWC